MSVAVAPAPVANEAAFIRQTHDIVRDLMPHKAWIYWADFLGSMAFGVAGLYLYLAQPLFSWPAIAGFLIAGFLFYRASVFTHELSHMAPSRYRGFRIVWNLLFGIPFLMPSFFYTDHRVHHVNQLYGTGGDAEYYPYTEQTVLRLILNLFVIFLIPFMLVVAVQLAHDRQCAQSAAQSLGVAKSIVAREHEPWLRPRRGRCRRTVRPLVARNRLLPGRPESRRLDRPRHDPWQFPVKIYSIYVFVTFVNQSARVCRTWLHVQC